MRRVFTSQRLETVEGVAKLLEQAGIAVHISNGRSYHGRRRGQFSYAAPVSPSRQPAVWIRNPEDQPRARALLRETGLMRSTRGEGGQPFPPEPGGSAQRWLHWIRLALLVFAAASALLIWLDPFHRQPAVPTTEIETQDAMEIRVQLTPSSVPEDTTTP